MVLCVYILTFLMNPIGMYPTCLVRRGFYFAVFQVAAQSLRLCRRRCINALDFVCYSVRLFVYSDNILSVLKEK